jgi:hypothetical protein
MTTVNHELYGALKEVGASEDTARRAAHSVLGIEERDQLVTKDFVRAELADLKAALEARLAPIESDLRWTKWIITGGVGLYALRSIVEWIR